MERTESLGRPRYLAQGSSLAISAVILIALALLTNFLMKRSDRALEYPLWAVLLGLGGNLVLGVLGVREKVNRVFRTELFLKSGLVLLGASLDITQIMSVGARGLVQALIMVTSVFLFTWWVGSLFRLDDKLKAVMCVAISVCGVSAAIAAAGSVLAKKEQLAYVTTLVILVALPLMLLMPSLAVLLNLPPNVAGAWFGGNIDTTAAVVAAGTLHSEAAMKVASIVKMSQNALIGVVAFALALYWVLAVERKPQQRPSVRMIWERFPKFVLGFAAASALASLGLFSKAQMASINALRNWAFTLAFVSIGLGFSFGEMRRMGTRPVAVFLVATVFNTLLALGVAAFLFA